MSVDVWQGLSKEDADDLRRAIKRLHCVEYKLTPAGKWQVVYFFRGAVKHERQKLIFGRILPDETGTKRARLIRWRIDGRAMTVTERDRRDWRKLTGQPEPKPEKKRRRMGGAGRVRNARA